MAKYSKFCHTDDQNAELEYKESTKDYMDKYISKAMDNFILWNTCEPDSKLYKSYIVLRAEGGIIKNIKEEIDYYSDNTGWSKPYVIAWRKIELSDIKQILEENFYGIEPRKESGVTLAGIEPSVICTFKCTACGYTDAVLDKSEYEARKVFLR